MGCFFAALLDGIIPETRVGNILITITTIAVGSTVF